MPQRSIIIFAYVLLYLFIFETLRALFNIWKQRWAYREFLRDQQDSHVGVAFYDSKMKRIVVETWKSFILEAKTNKVRS